MGSNHGAIDECVWYEGGNTRFQRLRAQKKPPLGAVVGIICALHPQLRQMYSMNEVAAILIRGCAASIVWLVRLAAQDVASVEYRHKVEPVLAKHCLVCHNGKSKVSGLNLEQPQAAVWEKVLDKVSTGRMPPAGSPRLSKEELAAVVGWIESSIVREGPTGPGRVTAHRLNRVEYNNTIRDLLGVTLRPADEFPLDDAGYGFDNIGDVLSVSPLLMEKYITAARRLSTAAVFGENAPAKPTKLIRYLSKKSQDDPTPGALPYSYRGAIYGSFQFPVDGEYELRMRVGNYRPRTTGTPRQRELGRKRNLTDLEKRELDELNRKAYPPVKMVLTLDGKQILTEVVEGNIDYRYAHGESVGRVAVTAGEHFFRASFPEFAGMPDPLDNVNTDGRRKLFIDYVDIVGPFQPRVQPPASRKHLFVCSEPTAECSERVIRHLTRRAYRRPATTQEIGKLTKLAALVRNNGDSFEESIRVAVQAVLMSPQFLFRIEQEGSGSANDALNDHDLASRLSYFLWSTMPDEQLMRLADRGGLRPTISGEVQRMLKDPRSDALIENFVGQWLSLRLLDKRKPDPAHYPAVDDELLEAMRRETFLFARSILREDRSVLEFLDGRSSFVNGLLARHYGIAGISGEAFVPVTLDARQRGGVMTQASVLTLSSYATRTSPVLRGKWVLENLLGTGPPPAPPDVPALKETGPVADASLRIRLEEHRANPSCAVCHNQMDPIGFGLENYDASGAWRDREGKHAIDSSGTLPSGSFNGPAELKQVLKSQSELFTRNLVEKMMTYALGRGLERFDRPAVDQIVEKLAANGNRFSVLIMEIVNSKAFQMRSAREGTNARR